jgi:hypothetical protein
MQELLTVTFIVCCCLVIVLWLLGVGSRTVRPPVRDTRKQESRKRESHKQYTWKKLDHTQLTHRIVQRMQH